jgi:hypothetical protein
MFRFTIRDVLWLTVVVALGVAWWADRTRITERAVKAERLASDHAAKLDNMFPRWRNIRTGGFPATPTKPEPNH